MNSEVNSRNVAAVRVARNNNAVISKKMLIVGVMVICFITALGGLISSYFSYVEEARAERLEAQQQQEAVEIARQNELAYQKYLDRKVYAAKKTEEIRIAKQKQGNLSESQFQLLAMVTFAEAGGQPYEDMVRVAETILNRIKSDRYPNTLEGVLNQPGQFETVNSSGEVVMGYQKRKLSYSDVPEACKKAVKEAMNGSNYLPEGALEFRGSNGHMTFF